MIRPGKYLCPYCAREYTEAFYRVSSLRTGALLVRDGSGKFHVEPKVPGSDEKPVEDFQLLSSEEDLQDGMPDRIRVESKEKKNRREYLMDRACPMCENFPEAFPPSYGKIPTYIVAVVGGAWSGKTAWLDAIAQLPNMNLIAGADFPCKIVVSKIKYFQQEPSHTQRGNRGGTNFLRLTKDGETYAIVILHDFAGELFENTQYFGMTGEDVVFWDILNRPDAYLFVTDETTEDEVPVKDRNAAFNRLYNECFSRKKGVPVGLILSHADKMMKGLSSKKMTESASFRTWRGDIPFLTETTFTPDTQDTYMMEKLLSRMELEDMIAMKYSDFAGTYRNQGIFQKSFLVKSCVSVEPDKNATGSTLLNDYRDGINVYDPLLWVLNQLNLFPL